MTAIASSPIFLCHIVALQQSCGLPGSVADCPQAGVGYTFQRRVRAVQPVADCSQAGVGYTQGGDWRASSQLRIAPRPGSVTL